MTANSLSFFFLQLVFHYTRLHRRHFAVSHFTFSTSAFLFYFLLVDSRIKFLGFFIRRVKKSCTAKKYSKTFHSYCISSFFLRFVAFWNFSLFCWAVKINTKTRIENKKIKMKNSKLKNLKLRIKSIIKLEINK